MTARLSRAGLKAGLWLWLVLLALAAPAAAMEQILSFDSTIKVREDGSLLVTEEILVRAEGRTIKRGIYRDFPVLYRNAGGYRRSVGFDVVSVTKNGQPEPYFISGSGDHARVYIGEKSVYLTPGEYSYRLTYETTRQLRYFKDYDELYWNVTGNKWRYRIGKASAHIVLPPGTTILNKAAFTGRYGDKGGDYLISAEGPADISFQTTRELNPYEGLTVAVGWPKGVVPEPSRIGKWLWRLWDNLAFVVLLAGTLGVLIYFYVMWRWIGRDPDGGPIFPRFAPPGGMSPAAVSYVHYMGFKRAGGGATKPFIAALISLAAKGRIIIDESGKDVSVKKAEGDESMKLPSGEKAIFSRLFRGDREEVVFKRANHVTVQGARAAFKKALLKEHGDVFFKNNYGWFALGLAASLLVIIAMILILQDAEAAVLVTMLTQFAAVGAFLVSMGHRRLWNWLPGGGSKILGVILVLFGAMILLPTVVAPLGIDTLPGWVPVCGIVLGIINVSFFYLMRAPTQLGKQIMDAVEGFKMYLSVAEAERLNMNDAPDVTEEIFEKFLPYAIGLGVEKPWSKAFEKHMARTVGDAGGYHYQPSWYHGSSSWSTGKLAASTAGLVGAVSAGMASASPPSSSGSSGGGGFSGGGGGGGGGGGW